MMEVETKRFWAEAAQRILGHEVKFSGPKGKATCHCAGASAAPGLRWCEAEWPRRQIRLCTGVGGECRIVRPTSLTETERGEHRDGSRRRFRGGQGRDGWGQEASRYLPVENDGEVFEIYSSMAKAVSVLPEDKREMAVESLMSTGKWTERGERENAFNGVSIERRRVK